MDRGGVRYEVLQEGEDRVPAEPVVMAMVVPPPPYSSTNSDATQSASDCQESKPPSYDAATNLPSYEEAERSKREEIRRLEEEGQTDGDSLEVPSNDRFGDVTIGTDGMFICTFVIAFLFNGIGFLFALCITNTVAGRCGALAGLGLSIVKWVVIVKHNNWAEGFAQEDSWLWLLLVLCGFLLFIRGAVQYIRIKYEWNRLTTHLRRYQFI